MTVNYLQVCTAGTDLQHGIPKIYEGKKYRNVKTSDIYSFNFFLGNLGTVSARNLTKGIDETLSAHEWFSFLRVPDEKSKRQKP